MIDSERSVINWLLIRQRQARIAIDRAMIYITCS